MSALLKSSQPTRSRVTGNPIDVHVGQRIRLRRVLLKLSQEQLGEALSLTFQQIQKYEKGINRVSASRLFDIAAALDVPIGFFFDDVPGNLAMPVSSPHGEPEDEAEALAIEGAAFSDNETLDLVRIYYRMASPKLRQSFAALVREIAATQE
jgi:transcriptional regulator with XRE-family HTH domain